MLRNGIYRSYIGYKNKTYVLYQGNSLAQAINVRKEADEMIKNGEFEEWIRREK